MLKPVNFTGIYRFQRPQLFAKESDNKLKQFAENIYIKPRVQKQKQLIQELEKIPTIQIAKIEYKRLNKHSIPTELGYEISAVVPSEDDEKVENISNKLGISFAKTKTVSMTLDKLMEKIEPAPDGKKLVLIDRDKLDYMIGSSLDEDTNISGFGYVFANAEEVNEMLAGNSKIPVTTLSIRPSSNSVNGYTFNFVPQKTSPDDCIYYALKAMGLKKIPMYVDTATDKNSYENSTEYYCRRLGLICDDDYPLYY